MIEKIGAGGMAAVFLAEDSVLGRKVAIKRLHADSPDDAVRRFRREAKLAAGLSHPNLVAVFDAFSEGEDLVVVMEYVAGPDLSEALRDDPPDERRGLRILAGVAAALDHVHRAGIVHRDVKPSNVLLAPDGTTAKLTDLGIHHPGQRRSRLDPLHVPGAARRAVRRPGQRCLRACSGGLRAAQRSERALGGMGADQPQGVDRASSRYPRRPRRHPSGRSRRASARPGPRPRRAP